MSIEAKRATGVPVASGARVNQSPEGPDILAATLTRGVAAMTDADLAKRAARAVTDILAREAGNDARAEAGRAPGHAGLPADAPRLPTPASAHKPMSNAARQADLVGRLGGLLGEMSLDQLNERLDTLQKQADARRAGMESASLAFTTAAEVASGKVARYATALTQADTANASAASARAEADKLAATLRDMAPGDAAYRATDAAARTAAARAASARDTAVAAQVAARDAHAEATTAMAAAGALATAVPLDSPEGLAAARQLTANAARMTEVMARFMAICADANESDLAGKLALFQAMQKSREADMEARAETFQQELQKQENAKRMGCIGKLIGALLALVSIAAAVFTGGASLVIATIGLGLMIVNEIVEAATGVNLMAEAIKPLTESILKPLAKLIGDAIASGLESLGVDAKTAGMVGSVVGTIVAVVAMIAAVAAVALVGKAAAARLAQAFAESVGKMVSRLIPEVLKGIAESAGKAVSQGARRLTQTIGMRADGASMQRYANNLRRVAAGGEVLNATVTSGLRIAGGVQGVHAAQALAEVKFDAAVMKRIEAMIEAAAERFGDLNKLIIDLLAGMSTAMANQLRAGQDVSRQTRAMRAA